MDKTVAVIGLGIMGHAIASNLIERGWAVVGYDIDAAKCEEMRDAGATIAPSIEALAAASELILTSLPSAGALMSVAKSLASSGVSPRIVAEMSTMTIEDKLAFSSILAEAGHIALDCPLSGTGAQAKKRDLVVYASGDAASIARMTPVFSDFAKKSADLGAYGNGSRLKFIANHLVAIHNVASAEAMVLAMKAGLDPHQVIDLVGAGAGQSRMFDLRAPMMARNVYEPATMKVGIWQKDMAIIAAFASSLGVEVPVFAATAAIYDEAARSGLGEQDTGSVCRIIETMAGVERH